MIGPKINDVHAYRSTSFDFLSASCWSPNLAASRHSFDLRTQVGSCVDYSSTTFVIQTRRDSKSVRRAIYVDVCVTPATAG